MSRGKKATEPEFKKIHRLHKLGASVSMIETMTDRSGGFIREILRFKSFEKYQHRNDQEELNKQVEQQNLLFAQENRPVGDYVDNHFRQEIISIVKEAFNQRPITETEVIQFLEDNEQDEALMERINWHSFTKTSKYKERTNEQKL